MGSELEPPPAWLEALQDVIYVIRLSPDFAFEFISDSVTDLVGYTPQEHYDSPDLGTRIVDTRDRHRLAAMTEAPANQRVEVTLRWISRDGRAVWTQHRCIKQIRPDGSMALIGSARDVSEQVRDRESLAAAREQYRLIAENASDVVFRGSNDGRIVWVSESLVDVLGWAPDDVVGKKLIEIVHPDDVAAVRQAHTAVTQGDPGVFEVRLRTRGGDWRWIAVSVRPVFDADGAVMARVGSWRDIQAGVTMRNALLTSEGLLRTMMERSTIGVILTDHQARITAVSDAACDILGCARESLLGDLWYSRLDQRDRDEVQKAFAQVLRGGSGYVRGARRLTRPDGQQLWLDESLMGVRDEHGQVDSCLIQIYDTTEAMQDQQALHDSREEYRLLAENAADVVLRVGAMAQATWISPSAKRLTGYEASDLLGNQVLDFVHPLDSPRAGAALARVFSATAESATEEVRIRHKDGTYAWWQASAHLTGESQVVLTLRNIQTEVAARQEAALEQARRAAAVQSMLDPHLLLVALHQGSDPISDFQIVDVNDAACQAFGLDRRQLVGTRVGSHAHRFSAFGLFEHLRSAMQSGDPLIMDGARYLDADGEQYLDLRAVRVGTEALSLTWRDVTDRHHLLADLADSRARYRAIMQSELEPHITMQAVRDESGAIVDFTYTEANPAALDYLGMTRDTFAGTRLRDMYPSEAAAYLRELYAHTVETGEPLIADDHAYPTEMFAGETRWYDLRGARLGDGLSLAWRDVTDRHQSAHRLAESEQRYRLLAENAAHVVFHLDSAGHFSYCSDGVEQALGWTPAQLIGNSAWELLHLDDRPVLEEVTNHPRPGLFGPVRVRLRTSSGDFRWAEFTGRRAADGDGLVGGWRDITAEVQALLALETQARHDALTGLLNRSQVIIELQQALEGARCTSVLYLDLDNLKSINDTHGHAAGDRALLVTAQRIRECLQHGDLAARIGGDEFLVVLIEGRDPLAAAQGMLLAVGAPIPSHAGLLASTVSIGVARARPGDNVDTLIARADRAMYRAKASGGNTIGAGGGSAPRASS